MTIDGREGTAMEFKCGHSELEEVAEWIKTEIQIEGKSAENAVISAGFGCFGKNESN